MAGHQPRETKRSEMSSVSGQEARTFASDWAAVDVRPGVHTLVHGSTRRWQLPVVGSPLRLSLMHVEEMLDAG